MQASSSPCHDKLMHASISNAVPSEAQTVCLGTAPPFAGLWQQPSHLCQKAHSDLEIKLASLSSAARASVPTQSKPQVCCAHALPLCMPEHADHPPAQAWAASAAPRRTHPRCGMPPAGPTACAWPRCCAASWLPATGRPHPEPWSAAMPLTASAHMRLTESAMQSRHGDPTAAARP